jgi:hypothetical protein
MFSAFPPAARNILECLLSGLIGNITEDASINICSLLKRFSPDLNLRDSQTVSDDGDSVH